MFVNDGIINGNYRYPAILEDIQVVVQYDSLNNSTELPLLNLELYELSSIWWLSLT